jgi:histidinol phosphatase-like PHP family hydrolase
MIDLHTHSFFSDGELVPAEHLRRVEVLDYEAIAITDHADSSNMDFIIPRIIRAAEDLNRYSRTKLIPGIELTHIPPNMIGELTKRARELGALVVVGHGETVTEPVASGTNLTAIQAGVDILAHPGFITQEEAALAALKGVMLELSGRKGHSLAVNSDGHGPDDFMTAARAKIVALGAGVSPEGYEKIRSDMAAFVKRILK